MGDGDGAVHGLCKWGILCRGWTVADSAAHAMLCMGLISILRW